MREELLSPYPFTDGEGEAQKFELIQGYTANKLEGWYLNPGSLTPELMV